MSSVIDSDKELLGIDKAFSSLKPQIERILLHSPNAQVFELSIKAFLDENLNSFVHVDSENMRRYRYVIQVFLNKMMDVLHELKGSSYYNRAIKILKDKAESLDFIMNKEEGPKHGQTGHA